MHSVRTFSTIFFAPIPPPLEGNFLGDASRAPAEYELQPPRLLPPPRCLFVLSHLIRGSSESHAAALREGETECQLNFFSFFFHHPPSPPPALVPVLQRGREETEAGVKKKKFIRFHSREKWQECRRHVSRRGTPARGPYFRFPYMCLF